MESFIAVLEVIYLLARIIYVCYAGYKFLTGDKKDISTFWYGILLIALLV